MFKLNDRVQVNLPQGTKTGEVVEVFDPPRGHEYYRVKLDQAIQVGPLLIEDAIANPWDLFPVDDDNEGD